MTLSSRILRFSLFCVLLLTPAGKAQAQDDPHAACAAPPSYVPAELLERPVGVRHGYGNSHEVVTTRSSEAQVFYDQGLNQLESYVWIEASRSFRQALRLDPGLAMAYLGLSYVQSGLENPAAAQQMVAEAKKRATGASEHEKRRIAIREKQLAAMADIRDTTLFLAYRKTIDDALAKDLEAPQLWLLRGNAEEANASGRGQRGTAASTAFYESVLRLVSDHATAHHYLVHSYENFGRVDLALAHGEAYARLSPAVPHAAHMWGHDLRRAGRVDDAIVQFLKADSLENAYYAAEGIDPALDWHHAHNLDLLAGCYEYKGQMKLAEKTLRGSAALAPVSSYRAFNMRELPNFLIHDGRYEEALKEALALTDSRYVQARCVGHALAGQALLWLHRPADADKELAAAVRELAEVPVVTLALDPPRSAVAPWVDALRGDLLLRTGELDEGRAVLKDVVRALRAATGPDAWSQALFRLESMAHTAMEVGDWELAGFIADEMREHDPAYGGTHSVRALVLRHGGDDPGAEKELAIAAEAWREADTALARLVRANAPGD